MLDFSGTGKKKKYFLIPTAVGAVGCHFDNRFTT
jgi:hypothetical protein